MLRMSEASVFAQKCYFILSKSLLEGIKSLPCLQKKISILTSHILQQDLSCRFCEYFFFIFVVFLLFTGLSFDTCQCSANVAFVLCQKVRTCVFIMYSIVTYTSLLSSLSDH